MRNYLVFVIAVAITCIIVACGGEEKSFAVTYNGSAIKGPFYAGGNVTAFACDATGKQTGQAYTAYIENATGNFTLDADVSGTMIVKAEGVYFNELYNESSTGTIRVEAVFNVTGPGSQNAFLNPISHAISACKLKKIKEGTSDTDSELACADLLFTELSLPKPDPFTLDALRDIQTPYPIAFSCGISQASRLIAQDDKTKFDTELQRILDQTKIELASGALSANTKTIYRNGFATLDSETCRANLQVYLNNEGGGITIPPLGAALDSDGDGTPDSIDEDLDNDGVTNELDCVNGTSSFVHLAIMSAGYFCSQKNDLKWSCKSFTYDNAYIDQQSAWEHNFTEVASGNYHICGLKNYKIWCWFDAVIKTMSQTNEGDWSKLYAGKENLCAISKIDNFLYCWQNNLTIEPLKVSEEEWLSISLGNKKIWGIKADGSLWNWNYGEVITNQIGTDRWSFFSNDSLYAIMEDGTLWSFDDNSLPLQVGSDTNWKMVAGTCAIKTDNTTWCWDEDTSIPAQKVSFGYSCGEWQKISHSKELGFEEIYCGIKSDHSLWCWKNDGIINIDKLPTE